MEFIYQRSLVEGHYGVLTPKYFWPALCAVQVCSFTWRTPSGREMQKVICLPWNCLQKPYWVNQGEMQEALMCLLYSIWSLEEGDACQISPLERYLSPF